MANERLWRFLLVRQNMICWTASWWRKRGGPASGSPMNGPSQRTLASRRSGSAPPALVPRPAPRRRPSQQRWRRLDGDHRLPLLATRAGSDRLAPSLRRPSATSAHRHDRPARTPPRHGSLQHGGDLGDPPAACFGRLSRLPRAGRPSGGRSLPTPATGRRNAEPPPALSGRDWSVPPPAIALEGVRGRDAVTGGGPAA